MHVSVHIFLFLVLSGLAILAAVMFCNRNQGASNGNDSER